jgi:hypothetical protein
MPSMQRVSPEEILHVALCQAVGLMNGSLIFAQSEEGQQVRNTLRTALTEYADAYMDQPVTEAERAAMIRGHANSAVDVEAVRGTIFRMKDNHKLRESRCKPDPLISIWANELARAIGDEK